MTEDNLPDSWLKRILFDRPAAVDDRSRMRAVANNLILHLHPTKVPADALRFSYTWGLGGMSAVLASLLVITGVLLMFRYDASVERAYASIQFLETQVPLGSLVRAIHHWSANLLVITAFLHLLRVFFTGGFKRGRAANWLVGFALLLLVLSFNFTGYLLPWDQLAYWAVTVGTSLLGYIPILGQTMSNFLLGGPEVGQMTLRNFYAIHVAVLPVLLVILMSYHFWKVRKDGGISQPERDPGTPVKRLTTIPHLVRIELAVTAILLTGILVWSMLVPAPLEALANPTDPPNPAKAAWYFLGLQELLLHMHPLSAMLLTGIGLAAFLVLPRLDKQDENIGIYFRSAVGRRTALAGLLMSLVQVPLLVVVDEFWLDLPALLPTAPTWVSNGLMPLVLTFAGLVVIYLAFRKLSLRASRSEALLGIFTYVIASLVILTAIGVFFRGPGMKLIWPFS